MLFVNFKNIILFTSIFYLVNILSSFFVIKFHFLNTNLSTLPSPPSRYLVPYMPSSRLVNSQGRKYWLPIPLCSNFATSSSSSSVLHCCRRELRLPLSRWVWEFWRSCGREGGRERGRIRRSLVVVVAVGVVRGKKRIWV